MNLIDHLPADSAFYAAMVMDEEYAKMVVEMQDKSGGSKTYSPSMQTWTQESSMLATVIDKLTQLDGTLRAVNGNKAPAFVPYPRPKTAIDKVRAERRENQHKRIVSMLLPSKKE